MRSILHLPLLFIGLFTGVLFVSAAAPNPKPTPTPTASPVPTPKSFPNIVESIVFLNHPNMMKGFIIFATPAPPSPSPKASASPKASSKPSAKPASIPSQEKISGIDNDCGFANAGGTAAPNQTFVPGAKPTQTLAPCMGVYVDAKNFLALFNAKIKKIESTQNPDPAQIDWSKAKQYYRGSLTFTYCKKNYDQTFYMSKLASFQGKPMIDPLEVLAQLNPNLLVKYHVVLFLPSQAAMDAANKAKAPQPPYTLEIQGAIPSCGVKKPGTGFLMDLESTTDGHDPKSGGEIHAVVTSHIVLHKSSGSLTFYKPLASNPPTTIGFQGIGQVTYESATLSGAKDCSISGTTPGNATVDLLGGNTLAIGFPPTGWPQELITCPYGGGPAPTWWGIFMYTHKSDTTVSMSGGMNSMMPFTTLVLPLTGSVDGTQTYTSSYSGANESGTQITENTTITLTPCTTMNCH